MPFSGWYGAGFGFGADAEAAAGLSEEDLALLLLSLLEEQARPGYELALALDERSDGAIHADPGLVYPLLQLLADRELITVRTVEGKKEFEITDQGRDRVEKRRRRIEGLWRRARVDRWTTGEDAFGVAIGSACHSVREAFREASRAMDEVLGEALGCCAGRRSRRRRGRYGRHGSGCC